MTLGCRWAFLGLFQLQPPVCSSAFRNVLSMQELPRRMDRARSGGPGRWPAALTLSWLQSASPMDAAKEVWGAQASGRGGEFPSLWPICWSSHLEGCVVEMSEIFVFQRINFQMIPEGPGTICKLSNLLFLARARKHQFVHFLSKTFIQQTCPEPLM